MSCLILFLPTKSLRTTLPLHAPPFFISTNLPPEALPLPEALLSSPFLRPLGMPFPLVYDDPQPLLRPHPFSIISEMRSEFPLWSSSPQFRPLLSWKAILGVFDLP